MDLSREGAPERKALDKKRAEIAARSNEIEATINAETSDVDLTENCRRAVRGEIEKTRAESAFDSLRRSDAFLAAMDFPGVARYQNIVMPGLTWGALFRVLGEERAAQMVFETSKRGATTEPGLPNAEREKRIADLREQLKKLERAEEIEVLKLEAAGFNLLRRDDIDPAVIFDVWATYDEAPAAPKAEAEAA